MPIYKYLGLSSNVDKLHLPMSVSFIKNKYTCVIANFMCQLHLITACPDSSLNTISKYVCDCKYVCEKDSRRDQHFIHRSYRADYLPPQWGWGIIRTVEVLKRAKKRPGRFALN